MKDPTSKHYEVAYGSDGYADDYPGCAEDGAPWPCKKVRKWEKSKGLRLAKLESSREVQVAETLRQNQELARLRAQVSKLDLTLKGLYPALCDLLKGKTGGTVEVGEDVEHQDFSDYGGRIIARVEGVRDPYVNYTGPDGNEYRNGVWVRQEFRKP